MAPAATLEKPTQSGEEDASGAAGRVKRPASSDKDVDFTNKTAAIENAEQTFHGGCHCGRVQYAATFDPTNVRATRCNCTFCQKLSMTMLSISASALKLLKPASRAEVDDYALKTKTTEAGNGVGHRYFCRSCSVMCWSEGWYKFGEQRHEYFLLNLASIDQPQDKIDLSHVQVSYLDGLHDNQRGGFQDKPWSGGLP